MEKMMDVRELKRLRVGSLLCRRFGDHETVPCKCEEEGRDVCPFGFEFWEEADAIIDLLAAIDDDA
jgi:hypothetical protein